MPVTYNFSMFIQMRRHDYTNLLVTLLTTYINKPVDQ